MLLHRDSEEDFQKNIISRLCCTHLDRNGSNSPSSFNRVAFSSTCEKAQNFSLWSLPNLFICGRERKFFLLHVSLPYSHKKETEVLGLQLYWVIYESPRNLYLGICNVSFRERLRVELYCGPTKGSKSYPKWNLSLLWRDPPLNQ